MRNAASHTGRKPAVGRQQASARAEYQKGNAPPRNVSFRVSEATAAQVAVLCLRDGLTKEQFLKQAVEAFALMRPGIRS